MLLLVMGGVPVLKESMLSYNTGLKASCSSAAFGQQSGVESTEKMSHPELHHGAFLWTAPHATRLTGQLCHLIRWKRQWLSRSRMPKYPCG